MANRSNKLKRRKPMDAWDTRIGMDTMEALKMLPTSISELTDAVKSLQKKNLEKEIKPEPKDLGSNDRAELFGQMIDIIEDFLDDKGITAEDIPNEEREDDVDGENLAIIYGSDYDFLRNQFEHLLISWGFIEKEAG